MVCLRSQHGQHQRGIISNIIYLEDTSAANIGGGFVFIVRDDNSASVNVTGGGITELEASDTSTADVSGGVINTLSASGTSIANVNGGAISTLATHDTSILDLFGTGLTETFLSGNSYTVTGTLQNGNPLNADYNDYGGTLEFNGAPPAVPEASSVVSLGLLLLLGAGGVVVSRRRRANAAG